MRKQSILSAVVLALLFVSLSATVYADTSVSVYVLNPFDISNGAKGLSSGGYWVGEIPITISVDSHTKPYQTNVYCIDFDRLLNIGEKYPANIVAVKENEEWKAVSYLLTWYAPPTSNEGAAANQVAIWRLLNETRGTKYYVESWLDKKIDASGNALATLAWGKDVVREGDKLTWISPITSNMSAVKANPGETITFVAQLTDNAGTPRPNVKVIFGAKLTPSGTTLNSAYVNPMEAYTDSKGVVEVKVEVPADTPYGASIEVKASTKSVWPQNYVDLESEKIQNLIGMGKPFELTLSTNVCVLGYIMVVPESPLGAFTAIGACGAAFALWTKYKLPKKY
jgi:hypothetical protein